MSAAPSRLGGGVHTMRRIITFVLLFAMVAIAATGLSGLLGRLLDAGNRLVADDITSLALWLAFTLVAGPLAAVLWWLIWRWLTTLHDRESVLWALYLAGMSTVALISALSSLLAMVASLVTGTWRPGDLGVGIVWAAVWVWHRWMWRHATKAPTRLPGLAPVIGSFIGLVIGVGGAVTALGALFDVAIQGFGETVSLGSPWWHPVLQGLVWAVGGGLAWWWHWVHDGVRRLHTGFAEVMLVIIAGFGSAVLCLAGIATALFVLLRLAFDPGEPVQAILNPMGQAVASALVGALVWIYHRRFVTGRGDAVDSGTAHIVQQATRLVTSGVGLAAAASGLGVIVNSILATVSTPLADSGVRTLLLGGISALIVGGPVWWAFWRPTARPDPTWNLSQARRVYLVVVFGASAVVALISLIVIGYRIFEFTLGDTSGDSLIDRVRASVGLLTATVLVAAYHFAVWRHDRPPTGTTPRPVRTIGSIILVAGADAAPLARSIEKSTGADVTVWARAGAEQGAPTLDQVTAALAGVSADRVLVVAGPAGRVEVIPLQG